MTSGESERMYARHVPHTFFHLIPKYKNSPEPRKIPGSFLCTPDWIRTSDLQSRSLTLYPTELRARSLIIVAHKGGKIKGFGRFCLMSLCEEETRKSVLLRCIKPFCHNCVTRRARKALILLGLWGAACHDRR